MQLLRHEKWHIIGNPQQQLTVVMLGVKDEGSYIKARLYVYPSRCGPVKQPENSVKIQPYDSRPTLCPKSRI
jgi:hypothetical protein